MTIYAVRLGGVDRGHPRNRSVGTILATSSELHMIRVLAGPMWAAVALSAGRVCVVTRVVNNQAVRDRAIGLLKVRQVYDLRATIQPHAAVADGLCSFPRPALVGSATFDVCPQVHAIIIT